MKTKLIGLTVLILFFTALMYAQPDNQGKRGGKGDCIRLNNLNLTDAQKTEFKELRNKHVNEVGKLRDELDKLRIDKRAILRGEDLNRSNFLDIEKKMSGLREKIALLRAEHQMDMYEKLTDEQKSEFRNNPMRFKGKMGEGFHKRRNQKG